MPRHSKWQIQVNTNFGLKSIFPKLHKTDSNNSIRPFLEKEPEHLIKSSTELVNLTPFEKDYHWSDWTMVITYHWNVSTLDFRHWVFTTSFKNQFNERSLEKFTWRCATSPPIIRLLLRPLLPLPISLWPHEGALICDSIDTNGGCHEESDDFLLL